MSGHGIFALLVSAAVAFSAAHVLLVITPFGG
jgi:hypothetical protein